eukprot:s1455_g14.t1
MQVYEQANSLNPDRRCHFLDTFQDFLEDKYRDLLLEATLPGPDKSFCGTSGMADSCNARIRRCRRGSPGHLRFAALRQGLRASRREPDALEACLSHSVGSLAIPKLIKELQVKYISSFGTHSWGSQLFEKQKELAADAWPKSSMGTWPVLTHIYRRRPCGVTESGRAKDLEKLAKIGASEISPFFYPEEAAACSVTLITEPSMSLAGQVMSIARDGEGTLERIFLDDQLPPEASSDVAQARFAKGTKLTIIEPMLVVSRDGLRGMAVQAGLAAIAWTWGKLAKKNMTLMDQIASHTWGILKHGKDGKEMFGSCELAGIAWSFACFALYHSPLLDALADSLCHGYIAQSSTRDLATFAWSLARVRYMDQPVFGMMSRHSLKQLSKRRERLTALDARQVASIVWSCTQLKVAQLPLMPLLDALDSPLLDDLPAQQVGWLADSMPLLPSCGRLLERFSQRLGASVKILEESLSSMAAAPDGFSETSESL